MNRIRSVLAVVAALLAARRHVHQWNFDCRPTACSTCGRTPKPLIIGERGPEQHRRR